MRRAAVAAAVAALVRHNCWSSSPAAALGGTLRLSGVAAGGIDITATVEVPSL